MDRTSCQFWVPREVTTTTGDPARNKKKKKKKRRRTKVKATTVKLTKKKKRIKKKKRKKLTKKTLEEEGDVKVVPTTKKKKRRKRKQKHRISTSVSIPQLHGVKGVSLEKETTETSPKPQSDKKKGKKKKKRRRKSTQLDVAASTILHKEPSEDIDGEESNSQVVRETAIPLSNEDPVDREADDVAVTMNATGADTDKPLEITTTTTAIVEEEDETVQQDDEQQHQQLQPEKEEKQNRYNVDKIKVSIEHIVEVDELRDTNTVEDAEGEQDEEEEEKHEEQENERQEEETEETQQQKEDTDDELLVEKDDEEEGKGDPQSQTTQEDEADETEEDEAEADGKEDEDEDEEEDDDEEQDEDDEEDEEVAPEPPTGEESLAVASDGDEATGGEEDKATTATTALTESVEEEAHIVSEVGEELPSDVVGAPTEESQTIKESLDEEEDDDEDVGEDVDEDVNEDVDEDVNEDVDVDGEVDEDDDDDVDDDVDDEDEDEDEDEEGIGSTQTAEEAINDGSVSQSISVVESLVDIAIPPDDAPDKVESAIVASDDVVGDGNTANEEVGDTTVATNVTLSDESATSTTVASVSAVDNGALVGDSDNEAESKVSADGEPTEETTATTEPIVETGEHGEESDMGTPADEAATTIPDDAHLGNDAGHVLDTKEDSDMKEDSDADGENEDPADTESSSDAEQPAVPVDSESDGDDSTDAEASEEQDSDGTLAKEGAAGDEVEQKRDEEAQGEEGDGKKAEGEEAAFPDSQGQDGEEPDDDDDDGDGEQASGPSKDANDDEQTNPKSEEAEAMNEDDKDDDDDDSSSQRNASEGSASVTEEPTSRNETIEKRDSDEPSGQGDMNATATTSDQVTQEDKKADGNSEKPPVKKTKRRRSRTNVQSLTTKEDSRNDMTVSVVTWNLAELAPSEEEAAFIRTFRKTKPCGDGESGSDFVLISGQECENIKPRRSEGHRSREYRRLMVKMLGKKYIPLAIHSLGGIQFGLFCKRSVLHEVELVKVADVTCGIGNVFHNKGAIAAFLQMKARNGDGDKNKTPRQRSMKMMFVTAHMAAHVKNVDARNMDYWRIATELEAQAPPSFLPRNANPIDDDDSSESMSGNQLMDSLDHVFFCGDLNYRLDLPREKAEQTVSEMKAILGETGKKRDEKKLETLRLGLLQHDQLLATMAEGGAFPGFAEGKVTFLPTFKFDKGTKDYDTSHKQRIPAWTDRVLFRPPGVRVMKYASEPDATHSDHRPVHATFRVNTAGRKLEEAPKKRRRQRRRPHLDSTDACLSVDCVGENDALGGSHKAGFLDLTGGGQ